MKKLYSFLFALLTVATLMGQAPESFKYQAVLRNARGDIKSNSAAIIGIDILKGSATGIKVYSETHNVTTDSYGLINLEIGKGTSTLGTLSDIDWSAGSYYIKLIVDGNIMGTAQLLSVPYALYAKTSGNVISNLDLSGAAQGDILQFNGTKWVRFTPDYAASSHTHSNATTTVSGLMSGTDKTRLDGLQNANGSETKVTAGTTGTVNVAGTGTATDPYIIDASINSTEHYIGEKFGGGIVFFVYDNGHHGLIAAPEDVFYTNVDGPVTNFTWDFGYTTYTGASGDGLGAGAMNTPIIVAAQINNDATWPARFAAKLCIDYSVTIDYITYGGWYLPSKYELNLLYLERATVGGFIEDYYWSSTEYYDDYYYVWYQDFYEIYGGYQDYYYKSDYYRARAIRAF